jgi:replicative DNA helicase
MRDTGTEDIATLTLGELMAKPEDPYDWVIPNLLERMDRLILTGEEGLGKSVFLRQLALMGAAGIHPFTRAPMKPIKAHIIDLENTRRHVKRQLRGMWMQAKIQGQDPSDRVAIDCRPQGIDICRDADLSWVNQCLDATQPDLLIIGPLYKLAPRALQTDDHVAPVMAAIDSIRARGIAIAMEAHAGHGAKNDERNMRPRGSAALMGWPEFGYGLRWNEIGNVDLVAWRGDRDERNWPPQIRRGGQWPWTAVNPQVSDEEWAEAQKEFA